MIKLAALCHKAFDCNDALATLLGDLACTECSQAGFNQFSVLHFPTLRLWLRDVEYLHEVAR